MVVFARWLSNSLGFQKTNLSPPTTHVSSESGAQSLSQSLPFAEELSCFFLMRGGSPRALPKINQAHGPNDIFGGRTTAHSHLPSA